MLALTFLAPGWLWLVLILPLVWFLPSRLRDPVHGVLRTLVLLGVVLALAHPVTFTESDAAWRVVVLDAHGSTAPRDIAGAVAQAGVLADGGAAADRTVLIRVGDTAVPTSVAERFDRVVHVSSMFSMSSLSRALEAAGRAIPDGARGAITILSDGRATDRAWGPAVQDLQVRGVPVHVLALEAQDAPAVLRQIEVPPVLRVGHTARLAVHVHLTQATTDVQLVDDAGVELARVNGVVRSVDGPVHLAWEPKQAGVQTVEVRLLPRGKTFTATGSNHRRVDVAVQEPLRVLYLGERMREGGPHLASLVGPGFVFDSPAPGESVDASRVQGADLVLVDDRPATQVPEALQETIVAAVERGETGLVMAGGRASFGSGGWNRQPLARSLPIEMIQKEEKRDPSTTLVIIIDTSGSMGGNRVQLAKEVSRLAIRRLLPHDKVGIVEFYGAKRWAAPIQPASNAIEIQRALNRLNAGGGTVIMPAIEEAFYGLQNVRTRYKHVLVLTDGGVETGAFEPLLRRMADKGITVSTVLIGPGMHSEFLVNIANWGKGRFYGVPNRFNLPEVILKQPASAHLPPWRPGTHVLQTRGAAGWWEGLARTAVPPLDGYVEARARPGADVLLAVQSTKHPVLASWRYGVGRATALMTEPTGPGTASWRTWPEYGTWLARVLARTASDARAPYVCEAHVVDGEAVLTARAQGPAGPPQVEAYSEVESGWRPVPTRVRAPGHYEARALPPLATQWRVRTETPASLIYATPGNDVTPELQVVPEQGLDLVHLAKATGGSHRMLTDAAGFVPGLGGGEKPVDVVPLWPWCLLAALLLLLVELAWRRRPGGAR